MCVACCPPAFSRYGVDKLPALAAAAGLSLEEVGVVRPGEARVTVTGADAVDAAAPGADSGAGADREFGGVSAGYPERVLLLRHMAAAAAAAAAPAPAPGLETR